MMVQTFNIVETIALPLPITTADQPIIVIDNNPDKYANKFGFNHQKFTCSCFVKELSCRATIRSAGETRIPQYLDTDTDSDRLIKALDVEWKSPRKQLSCHIGKQGQNWVNVGSVSLLNSSGYPYRKYRLMDLYTDALAIELGANSRIGVTIDEVGSGRLTTSDYVCLHGSVTYEFIIFEDLNMPVVNPPQSIALPKASAAAAPTTPAVTATTSEVLAADSNRLGYFIKNTGSSTVYLGVGVAATTSSIIQLTAGSYYSPEPYMQTLAVNAICATTQSSTLRVETWN